MQLRCASCGAEILGDDIHVEFAIAKCRQCKAVMDLAGRGALVPQAPAEAFAPRERGQVPIPVRFEVQPGHSELRIVWTWRSPKFYALLGFALFWDFFVLVWMGGVFSAGAGVMGLFGLLHAAVGVGLTYYCLGGLLNRTTIEAGHGRLSFQSGPLPYLRKNLELPARELKQLYAEEREHHGKNGTTYSYAVNAVLRDGRKQPLLVGLEELSQALYLEQQIEKVLNIQDEPVAGEAARLGPR
jgi:hypothetical protein